MTIRFKKYSKEQLIDAVISSTTIAQVLIKLNIAAHGGNYRTMHRHIKALQLDTSHFIGQGWSKKQIIGPKRPIEDYLSNKYEIQSYKLKLRLLNEKYFESQCYQCSCIQWLGQPIPLELHHIDGNHKNNSLSNLTLLCPNCHALTDNYRGKNKQ